jgi:hypothetical protein
MIQKYTHDGSKLLQQIGRKGVFDTSDGTIKGTIVEPKWPWIRREQVALKMSRRHKPPIRSIGDVHEPQSRLR